MKGAGPYNLKVCLAYSEVRKCACLHKSSNVTLFCSNVPAYGFKMCLADNLQDATDCGGLGKDLTVL